MRQTRSEARKQAKIKRHEKAVELQMMLEDRAAARSLQRELAELHRGSIRWAARFKVRAEPKRPENSTSPVTKRVIGIAIRGTARGIDAPRPASSWAVDALGMKGVIWQQSYLGRKSPGFHNGKARENWEYIVRDEAVLLDAAGEPVIISNMGDDWIEIGAAWQAMEDASTRANAKIQMLAIAPFDSDMSEAEMIAALRHFCTTVLDPLGLPYSAAIHAPPAQGDQRNFHPHIAFSLRPMRWVEPYCWDVADEVCGELDGRDGVQMLRHLWSHSMSEAAEQAESNRRYTGLGYGARRLDLDVGEHLGEARAAIAARGAHVWAHERNRIKAAKNVARRAIRDADHKIAALTRVRDAAIERMARHEEAIIPAKVFRATPPVEPAAIRTVKVVVPSASALISSAPAVPAKTLSPAIIHRPARPSLVARTGTPVEPSASLTPALTPPAAIRREATPPVRPAARLSVRKRAVPAAQLTIGRVLTPAVIGMPTMRVRFSMQSLFIPVPTTEARTLTVVPRPRPQAELAVTPTVTTVSAPIAFDLLDALARARKARLRRLRQRGAGEALRQDALPTLAATTTLETLPSLDRLVAEAVSRPRAVDRKNEADSARLVRLKALDPYVADYRHEHGQVETDYPALEAIGVGWDWLEQPGVQRGLCALRAEQQLVVAELAREAKARPLAFARTGSRFWPRDLPPDQLRRIDRWAIDPGFQQDVAAIQQSVARSYAGRDADRGASAVGCHPATLEPARGPVGLGGERHGTVPVFQDDGVSVRVPVFDTAGRPTDQLLMLLMLAGQHPDRIARATDGRLMALPGKASMLPALLHPWRQNDRVTALVAETVSASRAAGRPAWPASVAAAVRAYSDRTTGSSPTRSQRSDIDRGPAR